MLNYKLSDNAKFNAIWSLLNINYNEENNWLIEYDICEIYDNYAVVRNYAEGIFERVYYIKNDETDSVELGERSRCYIMDVSENEKNTLDALQRVNGGTYEKVDENYSNALAEVENKIGELNAANEALSAKTIELDTLTETYNAEKSENETKIGEYAEMISTLTVERDDAISKLADAVGTVNSLRDEVASLNSFKAAVELSEKQAMIAKYEKLLDAELLASYSTKLAEYSSAKALDKDLAYELVSANQSVFSANPEPQTAYIPKDTGMTSGLEAILDKYKK
jgi:chromosome segregation ATPase